MKRLKFLAGLLVLTASLIFVGHSRFNGANAQTGVKISNDTSLLPQRSDVEVAPLSQAALAAADPPTATVDGRASEAAKAVRAVERALNIDSSKLDPNIGVVTADVDPVRMRKMGHIPAFVVTEDIPISGQGPATWDLVYQKLCAVVDARTGRFLWAYATDPQKA